MYMPCRYFRHWRFWPRRPSIPCAEGAANSLDWFSVMTFSLFAGCIVAGWYAPLTGHPTEVAHWVDKRQPGYIAHINGLALFLAAALSAAWIVVIARMKRNALRGIVNSALGITLAWGLLATIWLPWLDQDKSYRAMIVSMQGSLPMQITTASAANSWENRNAPCCIILPASSRYEMKLTTATAS